jgi:hypothetical protein
MTPEQNAAQDDRNANYKRQEAKAKKHQQNKNAIDKNTRNYIF